jgi:leucyl aminopeptidase
MDITTTDQILANLEADALVVGVYRESRTSLADAVDRENRGVLTRLAELEEFTADIGKVLPLYFPDGTKVPLVLAVGLGPKSDFDAGAGYRAFGTATRWLSERRRRSVALGGDTSWSPEIAASAVAGALVGSEGTGLYQATPKRFSPDRMLWLDLDSAACSHGAVIGRAMNLTRRLVNEPPAVIYPVSFAAEARKVADAHGMMIEIWDEEKLEQERCGSLLAVARGSAQPPRLVIMRYQGAGNDAPWLALVGKGVTFDSGGLSIKPSEGMLTMKCDMAGAATVLGAMQAIATLKLQVNVMGLMGLVENMVSGTSYKLGDVLTARSGKTIEVHNTDAEGRLVLADVLDVAVEQGAAKLVDLATLTGACVVALGNDVAGLMSNDQAWCDTVRRAAEACGERAWQLPMFPEYGELIRGTVADIKNVGEGRAGGAITAAKLLEEFVGGKPWTHIDIAGPAFADKPKPWIDAGASGAMVRTLVQLARNWQT